LFYARTVSKHRRSKVEIDYIFVSSGGGNRMFHAWPAFLL